LLQYLIAKFAAMKPRERANSPVAVIWTWNTLKVSRLGAIALNESPQSMKQCSEGSGSRQSKGALAAVDPVTLRCLLSSKPVLDQP
jgi:hypothetical protein